MNISVRSTVLLAGLALLSATPLRAQRGSSPSLAVSVLNTSAAASPGVVRHDVRPNDVVRYTLTFTNRSAKPVANVELRNAIPAGVQFMPGSAHASRSDAKLEFSADGGRSWAAAPMELIAEAGRSVNRPVPTARYTHIRWVLSRTVAPAAVITADFEAKVGAGS